MSLIQWRDDFALGLAEVDHEHRELIDGINRLHEEIGDGADAEYVEAALGEIHADIAAHFALEEKHMASRHYDQFAAHKADHERLLDDILDMMDEVRVTGRYEPEQLSTRLSEWFAAHFRTHDARLHHWLG